MVIKMKVLSIKEPYATLIKEGKKLIETRSRKISYRGELYIHASSTSTLNQWKENKELTKLVNDTSLNFGNIICKCDLVDCIYITKEYIENIKKNNYQEYICGIYEEGRYAWVLANITSLEKPIKAKGQLNIWNYYNDLEVMNLMEDIEYGWLDKNNKSHNLVNKSFANNYILQSPHEVIMNKIGVCWDQVELERYYLKTNDWNIKTYFIVHYDNDKCPTHTFLTYENNGKFYWFEHSWEIFKGIHEYNTQKDLLLDVKNKFIKHELNNKFDSENLLLYEYKKPKYHISVQEFYNHCTNGKYIDFNTL